MPPPQASLSERMARYYSCNLCFVFFFSRLKRNRTLIFRISRSSGFSMGVANLLASVAGANAGAGQDTASGPQSTTGPQSPTPSAKKVTVALQSTGSPVMRSVASSGSTSSLRLRSGPEDAEKPKTISPQLEGLLSDLNMRVSAFCCAVFCRRIA